MYVLNLNNVGIGISFILFGIAMLFLLGSIAVARYDAEDRKARGLDRFIETQAAFIKVFISITGLIFLALGFIKLIFYLFNVN
jgi:hypothetical protein